jgi:hypothetical protein
MMDEDLILLHPGTQFICLLHDREVAGRKFSQKFFEIDGFTTLLATVIGPLVEIVVELGNQQGLDLVCLNRNDQNPYLQLRRRKDSHQQVPRFTKRTKLSPQ